MTWPADGISDTGPPIRYEGVVEHILSVPPCEIRWSETPEGRAYLARADARRLTGTRAQVFNERRDA